MSVFGKIKKVIKKNDAIRSLGRQILKIRSRIRLRDEYRYRINEFRKYFANVQPSDKPRLWHACVPHHGNLGDRAQWLCIHKWLQEQYPDREILEFYSLGYLGDKRFARKTLKKLVGPNDIIFFQSGYHFTGESRVEPIYHWMTKTFKNNKFVFMPVTFHFRNDKLRQQSMARYGGRKSIVFIPRDKKSYDTAKEMFPDQKVFACPDVVTTMIGKLQFDGPREGVLFCMRNDTEKHYTDSQLQPLFDKFENVRHEICDTNVPMSNRSSAQEFEDAILGQIKKFASYKCVVTDRFHGTIFSLVANTPVVVLQTADHKVTSGADWFTDVFPDFIRKAKDIDEAIEDVEYYLERNVAEEKRLDDYFSREYYGKLRQFIEE